MLHIWKYHARENKFQMYIIHTVITTTWFNSYSSLLPIIMNIPDLNTQFCFLCYNPSIYLNIRISHSHNTNCFSILVNPHSQIPNSISHKIKSFIFLLSTFFLYSNVVKGISSLHYTWLSTRLYDYPFLATFGPFL